MSLPEFANMGSKTSPSRSLTGIRVLKLLFTFFVESVFKIKSLVLVLMTSGSLKIVQTTASTHSGVVKLPSYLNFKSGFLDRFDMGRLSLGPKLD